MRFVVFGVGKGLVVSVMSGSFVLFVVLVYFLMYFFWIGLIIVSVLSFVKMCMFFFGFLVEFLNINVRCVFCGKSNVCCLSNILCMIFCLIGFVFLFIGIMVLIIRCFFLLSVVIKVFIFVVVLSVLMLIIVVFEC